MVETKYGKLEGTFAVTTYEDGACKACKLELKNVLQMSIGALIPKYQISEARTRDRNAIEFYENGIIKSIYLESVTEITTSVGQITCEFITFYKSGAIHRIFPTYGKISGMWGEDDEIKITPRIELELERVTINNKVSCICFFETGRVKSITLYTGETIKVDIYDGQIEIRYGIAFYSDGSVKSIEPNSATILETPIGVLIAYNNRADGISGDINSLVFDEIGKIKMVTTVQTGVRVVGDNQSYTEVNAKRKLSMLDIEKYEMYPIKVIFEDKGIRIIDSDGKEQYFDHDNNTFSTIYNLQYVHEACQNDCTKCGGCS